MRGRWMVCVIKRIRQTGSRSALRTCLLACLFWGEGKIKGMLRGSRLSRLQRCHRHSLFLPAQRPNRTHSAASVAVKAPLTSPLSGIQALIQTQINKSTHGGPALFSASWWQGICTAEENIKTSLGQQDEDNKEGPITRHRKDHYCTVVKYRQVKEWFNQ